MKIQYVSDLHLEFKDNKDGLRHMNTDADVLVIAGDLDVGPRIFDHLIALSRKRHVVFVYGNHEFYDCSPTWHLKKKGILVAKHNKNLHILDKESVIIGNTTFIGATGWIDGSFQNIDAGQYGKYNDFNMIYGFYGLHNNWGIGDRKYIQHAIASSETEHNIIVTHFLPLTLCISKSYEGHPYNACFANSWKWIYDCADKIDYWIHGHSHEFFKQEIGEMTFCRNPFGYPTEGVNFKSNEFIEI